LKQKKVTRRSEKTLKMHTEPITPTESNFLVWWQFAKNDYLDRAPTRVTRLGEFSPFGRLFSFGQFFGNYWSSPNLWGTFFTGKLVYKFWQKNCLGYILGGFSQTHLATLPPPPRTHSIRRSYPTVNLKNCRCKKAGECRAIFLLLIACTSSCRNYVIHNRKLN
jgi:hypothetical protein